MVVEHDLTLLDYLSEFIHILYGEAGAYGIVSPLQSTKVGINNFLNGYIPSDNIRFRDKSFKFDGSRQYGDLIIDRQIARYSDLSKSFSSFCLKACSSEIREGEIVGMVGGNALGKTTLMKLVSGVEKPDTGQLELQATVSYKPQYLNQNNEGDTRSFLSTAYGADIDASPVDP
jgi:ATP-binding cassette subfamily E protein 1